MVPPKPITLDSLEMITLRPGDHDAKKIWGGTVRHGRSGTPVTELQSALIAVGTLLVTPPDGQFGHFTKEALQRFQWYLRNQSYRLKITPAADPAAGHIMPYSGPVAGVAGHCDKAIATELLSWQSGNFVTTSPLVRLSLDKVSNVNTSDTFKVLDYPQAKDGEVLVHADFSDSISSTLNDEAKKAKVTLNINQTFRVQGVAVGGAVVTPAKKSQHLIGHAVDLNIVDGDTINSAAMFNAGTETDAADVFTKGVKSQGLRWGGDFADTDPVHFDDNLNPASEDYKMTLFFAQQCFEANHPMRVVG
jgi:D-alanyl-D-alanine carboxypeptidase-like protein/putative peptidoglycan binding protein